MKRACGETTGDILGQSGCRVTKTGSWQYLSSDVYKTGCRVTCVQSSTGTGKTRSTVKFAREEGRPVLAVSCRLTQVDEHAKVFSNTASGLPGRTFAYNEEGMAANFRGGHDNYVTTLNSLAKVRDIWCKDSRTAGQYIVYLDEFHSLLGYLFTSSTLDRCRRAALSSLTWLLKHAHKVCCSISATASFRLQPATALLRVMSMFPSVFVHISLLCNFFCMQLPLLQLFSFSTACFLTFLYACELPLLQEEEL